jgi:hypothetical protein
VTFTRATVAEVDRFGDTPIEGDELAVAAALAALGLDWSGTRMDGFRQRARALVREERRSIRVLAAALLERRNRRAPVGRHGAAYALGCRVTKWWRRLHHFHIADTSREFPPVQ